MSPPSERRRGGRLFATLNFGIQEGIARIAVPLFFVFSGYFLYRKTLLATFSFAPTKAYAWKLWKLYLLWSLIYLSPCVKMARNDPGGWVHGLFVYVHRFLVSGSYLQLWYLNASVFAVLFTSFLLQRRVLVWKILASALVLYGFGVFEQSWYGIFAHLQEITPTAWYAQDLVMRVCLTARDGLFFGFLFTSIGMLFAYYEVKLPRKATFPLFLLSMFLLLAEAFFTQQHHLAKATDMYFSLVPAACFAFLWIMQVHLPPQPIYQTLRLLSTLIFFSHPWVLSRVERILEHVWPSMAKTSLVFVLTVVATFLLSLLILRLSRHMRLSWLQRLYR